MKKFLIGVVVLALLVVLVGWLLPTGYDVDESVTIEATPAEIHPYLADLTRWPGWAPWDEEDASIEFAFGEKTTGLGASWTWTAVSGDGELALTRSDPATGIAFDLAFIVEGRRAPAAGEVTYSPSGSGTTVTWTLEGDVADFMPPIMCGYVTPLVDGEIEGKIQRGLAGLKAAVEGG